MNDLTTTPPGLIIGPIYAYSGGYYIPQNIEPGRGYWIKLDNAGQIILPESVSKLFQIVEYFPKNWGRIILTDATGVSYTLYAVKGETDLSQYELPPAPMGGMYDFRFTSGRIAENLSSTQSIEMSGIKYPVSVKVENITMTLQDETCKKLNAELEPGEELKIDNYTINKIIVHSNEMDIPSEYALENNYPNPFNTNTTIRFSIPKEVQVNLSVYNILGERVKELKNEMMKPGYYDVEFNASDLASGIYLYRIKAGDFISTKKMILMK